ncbi:aminoglycoside 6-adenylyltransferase [Providencia sp. PROV202]|uniref:aminoglycoside 6-adenylyltransferase n=1 Tax=Providencia sp. PROV202 TaxID=2949902 RepID=UPI0023494CF9|nr:aminoglycoside 6-adenylyltransferase [Providencia sp. PROV202]
MESPATLLNKIISISLLEPRIEAVILTGSRGRELDIDGYSDIDIELIGHGVTALFNDKQWVSLIATPLIALHLENGGENEPENPTCLVIYEEGRKVDFTFAEPSRLLKMQQQGLDSTYSRGFMVLLDKTGITDALPSPKPSVLKPAPLSEHQFNELVTDFWFEAHQVAIALTRNELWSAWSRSTDMKRFFLSLLEQTVAHGNKQHDVWYNGKHYQQWMPEHVIQATETIFDCGTAQKAALSLHCLMGHFMEAMTEAIKLFGYQDNRAVGLKVQEIVIGILKDNGLIPENLE